MEKNMTDQVLVKEPVYGKDVVVKDKGVEKDVKEEVVKEMVYQDVFRPTFRGTVTPLLTTDEQSQYIREILEVTSSDSQFAKKAYDAIQYVLSQADPPPPEVPLAMSKRVVGEYLTMEELMRRRDEEKKLDEEAKKVVETKKPPVVSTHPTPTPTHPLNPTATPVKK
jgi:hypothetical protein